MEVSRFCRGSLSRTTPRFRPLSAPSGWKVACLARWTTRSSGGSTSIPSIDSTRAMYLPKQFEETRPEVLFGLIRARPLGTLVVATAEGLSVDHLPFVLSESAESLGVLNGHIARANPLFAAAPAMADAVAIFQGPHHYITPAWYATKAESGKVVPTWNYVVVH